MECKFDWHQYSWYYFNHKYNVVLAWKDISNLLIEKVIINEAEFKEINFIIINHDDSKIEKEEFSTYGERFFPLDLETTKDDLERVKMAFKAAWEHHKVHNLHHHQTLKDYKGADWKCYLIEMLCDWIAMGWETGTIAYEYYQQNKDQIDLPEEYKILLEKIFKLINASECYAKGKPTKNMQARLYFK